MTTAAFERRYREQEDPWGTLTRPYEKAKMAATLAVCGPGPFDRACELGAGIGLYPVLGFCLLFVGCVLALRSLVLVFRRSWSP